MVQFECPRHWKHSVSSNYGKLLTSKLNEREGFQCLGHSNWTICMPLNHFCRGEIPSFSLSYWEANSYYPRGPIIRKGNSSNLKSGWNRGFSVPGTSKLYRLHPIKRLLFWNFPTFSLSYWEANSYYPRGPIMGKGNSPNFKIGWQRGFSVPGPFVLDHIHPFKLLLW